MSAPKPPSPKKVNPYEGMMSDPDFAAAAAELGYSNVNKDDEVRAVRELLLQKTLTNERNDQSFRKAERQLYKEGILTTNDPFVNKGGWVKSKVEDGTYATVKEAKQAYTAKQETDGENFIFHDDTDSDWELQKIYDRQAQVQSDKAQKKYERQINKQYNRMQKEQEEAARLNREANERMAAENQSMMEAQAAENRKLMEEMMNQPIYSAQQATLAPVQAKPKAAQPTPVAPAPPPAMNISTAPAPEMVSMGSPMGIVKQSSTSSQRSRRRTRGTSSLT